MTLSRAGFGCHHGGLCAALWHVWDGTAEREQPGRDGHWLEPGSATDLPGGPGRVTYPL